MKVGVVASFDAAHSLPGYEGKCKDLHGHTYTVEVVVEGDVDGETNLIIDYNELRAILRKVIGRLDHGYLNDIIDYPTSERIAEHIREGILNEIPSTIKMVSVKVWEGKDKWVMIDE
jgi:6-pyruvoyltetrahydropterin/6-carboxytetrahydropterin synthase